MSKHNESEPTPFEKFSTAMEIITLLASGGGSISTSQVVAEAQECRPGYELQIPAQYEDLPTIVKPMLQEELLEKSAELFQEQKQEERDREMDLSLLEANQPSISGGVPPNSEGEDITDSLLNTISSQTEVEPEQGQQFTATNETANQIISLIASSAVAEAKNDELENQTEEQTEQNNNVEGQNEQNNETEGIGEMSQSSASSTESEGEADGESGEGGE